MNYKLTQHKKIVRIVLSGGGSGGSVAPLLAVAEALTSPSSSIQIKPEEPAIEYQFLWLGTNYGPERQMVELAGIRFKPIVGGKFRRYWSLNNLVDLFKIKIAFWQSLLILLKGRPDLVLSAGSFVSVPVVWAAWLLRLPVLIHQQDIRPGLANKLMAPCAKIVTVTFEQSLKDYGPKAVWTGNPVRRVFADSGQRTADGYDNLKKDLPLVLILGGGTGALAVNQLAAQSLDKLTKFCRVIHLTGAGKQAAAGLKKVNYQSREFLDVERLARVYAEADLVVSRCGLSVLSELSSLGKAALLIPLPGSHQEDNARVFSQARAAVVLKQQELSPDKFAAEVKRLLDDEALRQSLRHNIKRVIKPGAAGAIAEIVRKLIGA